MNTHEDALTHTEEEELSDERVLANIQRRMRAATIPQEFDARALAARAVEQYWADRERGVMDREGRPLDDILLANRVALRRLRGDDGSDALNLLAIVLPLTVAVVILLLYPSLLAAVARLSQQPGLIIAVIALLLAVIVTLGFAEARLKQKWLEEGKPSRRGPIWLSVGGLFALTVTLAMGLDNARVQRLAAEERAARIRAEEDKRLAEEAKRRAEEDLAAAAQQGIIQFSHEKMREFEKSGSLTEAPGQVQTIPVGKKKIQVTQKKDSSSRGDAVVYRAEGEPLPEPVEIKLNKESGLLKVEGSSEESLRFYAAVVKSTSGDTLTLSVKDENGVETELSWNRGTLTFQPTVGQRLFVVVDPKTRKPVEVTQFQPSVKKDETAQPK